jgi:beta-lactamase class A
MLPRELEDALAAIYSSNVNWSVCVRDKSGEKLVTHGEDVVLSTASIGKLFLLLDVACRLQDGSLSPVARLARHEDLLVSNSGIWQYLTIDELPIEDLALLVASVSDNLATNVLLHHLGLGEVQRLSGDLGFRRTALRDRVKNSRGPEDEPSLSSGTAEELSLFMTLLARRELISEPVSVRMLGWLATNMDLSMVASGFGLDPLAHTSPDRGLRLYNKTGTDEGVRGDVGIVGGPTTSVSYAVLANWSPGQDSRDEVLASMHGLGVALRRIVGS